MELDNLHFNFRQIDGYNKAFNFIISEREAGKSTAWIFKAWNAFKEGYSCLVLRRLIVDITDIYITSIEEVINKFNDNPIKFTYMKGTIKEGAVKIFVEDKLFLVMLALSNPMSRIKSLVVRNIKFGFFDEFICNMKLGEKYLNNEAFKLKEVYNTFRRECPFSLFKMYFLGNPYSLYNPYFVDLAIPTDRLNPSAIVSGATYVVQCYTICEELKQKILESNPLYEFDNSYKKYAFDGLAINDNNISITPKIPQNYALYLIFRIQDKFINIYHKTIFEECDSFRWWVSVSNEYEGKRRNIYCINWEDMNDGFLHIDSANREKFWILRQAIQTRQVTFQNIEASYLLEAIYPQI